MFIFGQTNKVFTFKLILITENIIPFIQKLRKEKNSSVISAIVFAAYIFKCRPLCEREQSG